MFRIDKESKEFLKKLGEPGPFIKTDQEFGYLCFLYGLAKGVSTDLESRADVLRPNDSHEVDVDQVSTDLVEMATELYRKLIACSII